MSISTLVQLNSFKIFFSIRAQPMIDDTEEIILLTQILRKRRRKMRNCRATRSVSWFQVHDAFTQVVYLSKNVYYSQFDFPVEMSIANNIKDVYIRY